MHDFSNTRNLQRELTRQQVRKVWCPKCLAKPGELCRGRNNRRRTSNHYERVEVAAV